MANILEKIKSENWDLIYATQDTHYEDYLDTQEGVRLPVEHCIYGTNGWCIQENIAIELERHPFELIDKSTFGSLNLTDTILKDIVFSANTLKESECELTLVGVCTNICVISNVMLLKAYFPEMKIVVDASCCAGTTPERHKMALEMMKDCQIDVINEEE